MARYLASAISRHADVLAASSLSSRLELLVSLLPSGSKQLQHSQGFATSEAQAGIS